MGSAGWVSGIRAGWETDWRDYERIAFAVFEEEILRWLTFRSSTGRWIRRLRWRFAVKW